MNTATRMTATRMTAAARTALHGAGRRGAHRDERGSTLMEVVVGMTIMLIFLGIFTGAIVMVFQTSNRANALTASSGQTDRAFARLDKSVRYATAISAPGSTAAGWYVEYLTTATGAPVCTQLRVNPTAQQLQARTWPAGGSTTPTATGWTPWADGITNGAAPAGSSTPPVPFTLAPLTATSGYEQLTVALTATSGSPPIPASTNATFTALDSAATAKQVSAGTATTASVCTQVSRP